MGSYLSTADPPEAQKPKLSVQQSLLEDLQRHFEKRNQPVQDSWFVVSLEDQSKGIELFLAEDEDNELLQSQTEEAENVVDIPMPAEYETQLLDPNVELIESYPHSWQSQDNEQPAEPKRAAVRNERVSVKISQKEDRSMLFSPTARAETTDDEELRRLKEEVADLSAKLNRMSDLEAQIGMLQSLFSSISVGSAPPAALAALSPSLSSAAAPPPPSLPAASAPAASAAAAPPPPPPPPPGAESAPPRPSWREEKARPKEVSEADVERIVRSEIGLSGKTPAAIAAATDNFLESFKKPEHRKLLRKMALHYPFLIRNLPLQPLECVRKMVAWEKHLFRDMGKRESAEEVEALRKRKMIEICKLAVEEVPEEVVKIRAAEEHRIKKEKEAREAASTKGTLLEALKERFDREADENIAQQTEEELKQLQVGNLDDLDELSSL